MRREMEDVDERVGVGVGVGLAAGATTTGSGAFCVSFAEMVGDEYVKPFAERLNQPFDSLCFQFYMLQFLLYMDTYNRFCRYD